VLSRFCLCVAVKQLGLHWSLEKQRCDATAMTEYVSLLPAGALAMTDAFLGRLFNKVGLKCPGVRTSVDPSTRSFFNFNEIWRVGRGR